MLVTALGLAILFVTLALIVNTAIYTENLATRSSDIGGGTEAVRYHDEARSGVSGLIEFANYNENTSYAALQTELDNGVDAFDNRSGLQFAMSDRAVETTLTTSVNGTRITQTDETRTFTNTSGTADWMVVEDVSKVRAFRLNVSQSSLQPSGSEPFEVIFDDGTDTWTMTLSSAGSDVEVTIGGTTGSGSCNVTATSAWVNVTDGTLAGEDCEPLDAVVEDLSPPYEIRFQNGDNATGTYSVVVDNDTLAGAVESGTNLHLADDGDGQPFATHAIYAVNLSVTYETPRLFYDTTVRVAPGESDG